MKWKWTRGCLSSHALTAGCFVGGVVVENHVDVEFGSHAALDLAEEPQKLLMPVARQALVNDLPGGYVEGSKECRRAVTFVVMGHGSSAPLLEGKTWLVRSRAWIWLFSSKAKTTAGPGDRRRDPPRRATFQRVRISGQLEVLDAVGL